MNHESRNLFFQLSTFRLALALAWLSIASGCFQNANRNQSARISQTLAEQKTTTDNLRNAMRYLKQMSLLNRRQATKEVQLELNTWIQTISPASIGYSLATPLDQLPRDMLPQVGCENPAKLQFGYWDIDYLFERRMMNKLSKWIVDFPLRDSLIAPIVEKKKISLGPVEGLKLEEACKLFDWAMRNVALEPQDASVEQVSLDPTGQPISDAGLGYGYLPWETLVFSGGDYVERGRVFNALANQRGIDTFWIAIGAKAETAATESAATESASADTAATDTADNESAGKLWAIGVVIGDSILLFEPKLSMPILDPDTGDFATLEDARTNERILRRLDLPGQFEYAVNPGDLTNLKLLIDLPPVAASARMKVLEKSLLRDERMVLFHELNALQASLQRLAPYASVQLWTLPLMAQLQAATVRERLEVLSNFTMQYMTMHGVWLIENPASMGRMKHLYGEFENTDDQKGALSLYMESRIDNESIAKLEYSPDVQRELGVSKMPNEDPEQFLMRIRQAQYIFGRAKVDASYLMAQLHFDRGSFAEAKSWLVKRVIDDPRAQQWQAIGRYSLARVYEQLGDLDKAAEMLTLQPSPLEAGNRLRLRYLRRQTD